MTGAKTILVVEDEVDLADLITFNLEREGYRCRRAADGDTALAELRRDPPDVVILDRMLPKRSGDEVMTQLRRDPATASVPVIMLTAKSDESDELVGFALGADDYITKPFSIKRLLARVAAVLRRGEIAAGDGAVESTGPIRIDRSRHEVTIDGAAVSLTTTEFRLLDALVRARERVLSRNDLIDAAMGPDVAVTDRTIDVHVAALRKKIGAASGWIRTVRGTGYALRAPEDVDR